MSYPNDLEIVSTFAVQDIPPQSQPQPQQQPQSAPAIVAKVETPKEPESMDVDKGKDSLDAAISGEVKKEEGYESSDLELSSDEEEDNDSSSSDSSSEEEEDQAEKTKSNNNIKKTELLDDDEEAFADGIVKTAHEIVDIVVEKPNFQVTPDMDIVLAGSIFQIIDNVIVVHCRPGCEYSTLDQGSLLIYQNREIMGEVFETFGPVARPYYSVRFNDAKEINMEYGEIGASVYYVPAYEKTQIVQTEALKKIKGTDASNVYDEELGEDEMEFSDDEKEMQFRKKKNKEKKMKKNGNNSIDNNSSRPGMMRRQPRPPRDLPSDFDAALAAYEGSQLPPRQQQSYADLTDFRTPPPPAPLPPQQQYQQDYQSPADLVSALFKSYNGQLPTQLPSTAQPQPQQQQPEGSEAPKKTLKSIFAEPPPPIE